MHDLILNGRRVVTVRTSEDGFTWLPDTASQYFEKPEYHNNMRLLRGRLVPIEFQISPDDEDPPDLEFYSGSTFAHEGRYYMHMNNYAGSFIPARHRPDARQRPRRVPALRTLDQPRRTELEPNLAYCR